LAFAIDITLNTYTNEMYLQISPVFGRWCVRLGVVGAIVGSAITSFSFANVFGSTALAQVVADPTVGSTVSGTSGDVQTITGGTTRETNLFHSFDRFSVPTDGTAFFNNATDIQNILTRVTGGSRSEIDGLIRANGAANLFLLNPNGIVFGRNAQLDIGGSFVASTANAIQFGEQGFFSATDPNAPPLLTVNPSAFLFNQARAAAIENNSRADAGLDPAGNSGYFGLKVPFGQSLLLVGGDIKADGGGLAAFGGRVDLAAVAGTGTVGLNVNGDKLNLNVPDGLPRADVSLNNGAGFIVSAGGGGDIAITAKNINMNNSFLDAGILSDFGSVGAQAGDITLNATESISLTNVTQLSNSTSGQGNAGKIKIVAGGTVTFDGRDSSDQFPSGAFNRVNVGATGDSGGIDIGAGSLIISNRAQLDSSTYGAGSSGNITIETRDRVSLFNSILISEVSEEGGVGNGGDINIKTGTLLLKDGSALLADLENQGSAGNIKIEARDAVILEGRGPGAFSGSLQRGEIVPSQITATVDPRNVEIDTGGKGGDISISTASLFIDDGFVSASTFGRGNAGSISVDARRMRLSGGGQISAFTFGSGNAGDLLVTGADLVELIGTDADGFPSGLLASVELAGASGNGGNLTVETKQLNVRDGATISVSSFGSGAAGNLNVTAHDLRLDNGTLEATTTTGDRGNITVRSHSIGMRRGSRIATNASGDASGGNINIDTRILIAAPTEDNDIIANAVRGRGGNIRINAEAIFGIQQRSQQTPLSDITASSQLGVDGIVQLNSPEVDPSRDIAELPTGLVDASTIVASGCPSGAENRFTVAGRGGLPPAPGDNLSPDALLTDWATLQTPETANRAAVEKTTSEVTNTTLTSPVETITEASSWQYDRNGAIILTSGDASSSNRFEATPTSCSSS
jgi:filamentous hemagglutinin family protein